MTFESSILGTDIWGGWRVKFGTFTNAGTDTGGDIDTGLGNINCMILQKTGNGTTTGVGVVNETFPNLSGPKVTIVTDAGVDGVWLAIDFQQIKETSDDDAETSIFGSTIVGNKVFVCGKTVDSSGGAVEMILTEVLNKVELILLTPNGSGVAEDMTVVNETLPVLASGGVTLACDSGDTNYFLAIGTRGGT